jgi:hypothetical protein
MCGMGSDTYIIGELQFPAGAIERWRASPAIVADVDWPDLIADGILRPDDEDEDDDDDSSVDEALRVSAKLNSAFGGIGVVGDAVRIAFYVDDSNFGMVCDPVVRVVSAAGLAGATGRVRFLEGEDAIALESFNGARVTIGGGAIAADECQDEPLAEDDAAHIRASVQLAIESFKTRREPEPKAKAKPKAKPKAKAKAKSKPKANAKPKAKRR